MSAWFEITVNWDYPWGARTSKYQVRTDSADAALKDAREIYKNRMEDITSFSVRKATDENE